MDPQGKIPPDFASQVKLALANLSTCLASAQCTKENIIKCGMYIVGKPGNEEMDDARRRLYAGFLEGTRPPPDTLVYVAALAYPELLFEIDCMAVVTS